MGIRDILGLDYEQFREEDERARRSIANELEIVHAQLEMFNTPLWGYLKDHLELIEKQGLDLMIGSPIAEIEPARERVKLARQLLRLPATLEETKTRLEAELDSAGEDE